MKNGGLSRGERLQIMLNGDEVKVLDDFRFRKRMPSRAAAVRELLKRGLAAEGFETAAFGTKSEDYGVMGKTPKGREARQEYELCSDLYRAQLADDGRSISTLT